MLYIFVEILKLQFSGLEVSSSFPLSPIGTSDNTGFNQCFRGLEEKKNGVHFSLQAWNCENLFALIGRVVRLIIKQTFKLKVWNIIVWLCQQQHDDVVQKKIINSTIRSRLTAELREREWSSRRYEGDDFATCPADLTT